MIANITAGNYSLKIPQSARTVNSQNIYLMCRTNGSSGINIYLPRISPVGNALDSSGIRIFITDVDNNAKNRNITIIPNPADRITSMNSPVVIKTNGAIGILEASGLNSWSFTFGNNPMPLIRKIPNEVIAPMVIGNNEIGISVGAFSPVGNVTIEGNGYIVIL